MIPLAVRLDHYLEIRRGLGFDLSTAARVLRRFVEFAAAEGMSHITTALFLRWREGFGSADNNTWSARLGMVRGFAAWLQGMDVRTEVPPSGLVSGKPRRARPYIYSCAETSALVGEAARLPSAWGLRGWTYATFFGLITATGLRIHEAIMLDDADVDTGAAVLLIKRGKNGRTRLVPVTACTAARLDAYRNERDRILGPTPGPFFLQESGLRPTDCAARYTFSQICQNIGLRARPGFHRHGRGPRIHDLRHTFAVRAILNWYHRGLDPDREMFHLSTYLGHTKPEHTYWYIEAVPELLQLACQRAERSLTGKGAL